MCATFILFVFFSFLFYYDAALRETVISFKKITKKFFFCLNAYAFGKRTENSLAKYKNATNIRAFESALGKSSVISSNKWVWALFTALLTWSLIDKSSQKWSLFTINFDGDASNHIIKHKINNLKTNLEIIQKWAHHKWCCLIKSRIKH